MKKLDFNRDWLCRRVTQPAEPVPVTLPHDAMRTEPRTNESNGEGNTGWYAGYDYEYTKTFAVPGDWENQSVVLEFEGVYHNCKVWVNDRLAPSVPYGYTNFYIDLAPYLHFGQENTIRVLAQNSDQPNSRWYSGTGIYRPVWLYLAGKEHIPVNGVRIQTVDYEKRELRVTVRTTSDGPVEVEILDQKTTVVSAQGVSTGGQAVFTLVVPNGKLWDCDHPNLYTCRVRFAGDAAEERFGIRSIAWGTDGFLLNGRRVIIRGACIHHDNGLLGACAFPEAEARRVRILKENGYNALRSAHNPCSKALLDACDSQGMLMMDEYVDVWYIHKTKYDYAGTLEQWWRRDLREMVAKDFNHPCVIAYCTGNEVAETAQKKGIALAGSMTSYLHELDGTRPVTCGINIFFNFLSSIGLGVYSDDKAEKAASSGKGKKDSKKKPVGSAFYNALACLVGDWFMKAGATLPPCDWKTRDAYAAMDIAGYNYGLFRYRHDLRKYPDRLILGSETFCKDAYAFYELAKKHPRIIGDFVWSGMDYIGETGDGCAEYSDYRFDDAPCRRMTGGNGRIDLLGKPRAEAAYTRVAFERETGPFISVNPVYQKEKLRLTGWQLTKALESWSWRGCAGMPAQVEVYARADTVELLVNGSSVGKKQLRNTCRAVFHTTYQDGAVTAVSYDSAGKEIGRYTLITAKADTQLRVTPEESTIAPEGLGFVRLQYTDHNGVWKPMEKHTLRVTVDNGVLAGLGSANAYVQGNYAQNTTQTYYGEAMAVIRAGSGGPVRVTVTDEQGDHVLTIPVQEGGNACG